MKPSQNTHIENWGEGDIKPQYPETGGGQPYYFEFYYGIENCNFSVTGEVQVPNPDYKDPSDPDYDPDDPNQQDEYITEQVTEVLGIHDTASLQAWLAGLESEGCQLWTRKVDVEGEGADMKVRVSWKEATATDFEVISIPTMAERSVAFKAINDELINALVEMTGAEEATVVAYTLFFGWRGLRITHETGVTKRTMWNCQQLSNTDYIVCMFSIGVFTDETTIGGETFEATMDNNNCDFQHWD